MSKKINSTYILGFLFVLVVSVALVGADIVVLAQDPQTSGNTNSNTQNSNMSNMNMSNDNTNANMSGDPQNSNMSNMSNGNMSNGNMSNGNMSGDTQNTNMSNTNSGDMSNMNMSGDNMNTTGGRRGRRGRRGSRMNPATSGDAQSGAAMGGNMSGDAADLSGTYTGVVNYPEGGVNGDSTLTITGNQFTLTSGSNTQTGRVVGNTTRGYTAVTMQFGDIATSPAAGGAATATPPTIISLRARKTGDKLTLTSVSGEKHAFSFSPSGSAMGGRAGRRSRGRRGKRGMMSGSTTDGSMGTTTTTGDATATPTTTDTTNTNMSGDTSGSMGGNMNTGNSNMGRSGRRRGGRRGSRSTNSNMGTNGNMDTNGNINSNGNMNSNTPTP